jgi:hypothetical protein
LAQDIIPLISLIFGERDLYRPLAHQRWQTVSEQACSGLEKRKRQPQSKTGP